MAWREKNAASATPIPANQSVEIVLNGLLKHPQFTGTDVLHSAAIFVANDADRPIQVTLELGIIVDSGLKKTLTVYPLESQTAIKKCACFQLPGVVSVTGPQYSIKITNQGDTDHTVMVMLSGLSWTSLEY